MKLFIPTIGDSFTLIDSWTFLLHAEKRNKTLWQHYWPNKRFHFPGRWGTRSELTPVNTQVTLPAGLTIIIDRVYIRKGNSGYDSVTFIIPKNATYLRGYTENDTVDGWDSETDRMPFGNKNQIRFWTKLADTRNVECDA